MLPSVGVGSVVVGVKLLPAGSAFGTEAEFSGFLMEGTGVSVNEPLPGPPLTSLPLVSLSTAGEEMDIFMKSELLTIQLQKAITQKHPSHVKKTKAKETRKKTMRQVKNLSMFGAIKAPVKDGMVRLRILNLLNKFL